MDLVRLACVKHAASVHPEPGSNSPTKTWPTVGSATSSQRAHHPSREGSCGRCVLADLAEPAPYKGGGRPVSVLLPAGCADSEIDRQFCKVTRRRPDELPALAFCLLFRFQGAEAQARTGPSAFRWGLALVPDRLSGGVNPSVRRRTILTARAWRHNPPPGEISLRCTQDEISRRWCVFLPLRRRTYRPCSRSHSAGKEFSSIVTPFT